jgi:hypothetical protein
VAGIVHESEFEAFAHIMRREGVGGDMILFATLFPRPCTGR